MSPHITRCRDHTPDSARSPMMAHGMSVVAIERVGRTGAWRLSSQRKLNRRITASTPMRLTGPAAGHALVKTSADPAGRTVLGTLNNCAGGRTPWGTVLSGEENFNQYFGASAAPDPARVAAYARYGIRTTAGASERKWEEIDPRFDLAKEPNEPNRFGWVVEVDPYDPTFVPRKRTALGRFKHEGATIAIARDGRAVAYMGDDERFDYIYKFVSRKRFKPGPGAAARRHNMTLLDDGDLYVARFTGDSPVAEIDGSGQLPSDGAFDGWGEWLPLVRDGVSMVAGMSVAEVLVHTRLAADKLAPTKMDRPEDIERNPVNGRVYAALTNNSRRTGAPGTPTGPTRPTR
jgi:secreted PhoX family phosphatase